MKKILFSLIAVVALCYSTRAQVPTYAFQSLGGFTNVASTATNLQRVIDCRKQASVTLQWTAGNLSGSGTDTNSIFIWYSIDGITYTPNVDTTTGSPTGKRITMAATGTTPFTLTTNLNTFGCGYLRVDRGTNSAGAGGDTTNLLSYAIKISSP